MTIQNGSRGIKFSLILLDILSLTGTIIMLFDFDADLLFSIFTVILFATMFLITIFVTFITYGTFKISEEGILFNSLIYKKFCKWSDFKFIARYYVYSGRVNIPKEGYICSYKLEESKFNRMHTLGDFSNKYFDIPFSEELETYILMYGAKEYKGLCIDDRKKELNNS